MAQYKLEKVAPFYEQIYQSLKQLIFSGEYPPGYRINEVSIAKEFNVSRSPVREAIRALENEGLLVSNGKTLEVYNPSCRDIVEIYQCRAALESLAVELATPRAEKKDISNLEDLLERSRQAIENEDSKEAMVQFNVEFHDLILSLSGNERLQKLLDNIRSLTQFYRSINLQDENRRWMIFNEHYAIFLQIKQRDQTEASRLMKEHILHDMEDLKKWFEENWLKPEKEENNETV